MAAPTVWSFTNFFETDKSSFPWNPLDQIGVTEERGEVVPPLSQLWRAISLWNLLLPSNLPLGAKRLVWMVRSWLIAWVTPLRLLLMRGLIGFAGRASSHYSLARTNYGTYQPPPGFCALDLITYRYYLLFFSVHFSISHFGHTGLTRRWHKIFQNDDNSH